MCRAVVQERVVPRARVRGHGATQHKGEGAVGVQATVMGSRLSH
jgi:hypothetical protein